jgi:hypothetical protein
MFAMKFFQKRFFQVIAGILFLSGLGLAHADQVAVGSTVMFSVTADGTSPFSYQWKKDGNNLAGATFSTLTITNIQTANGGSYSVVVANAAGSTTSDVNSLTVLPATAVPAITTQPVSQSAAAGSNVSFLVAAYGTPTPTYQWQKAGINIVGATSATLSLTSVQASSAGTYTVVVTNSAGSVTSSGAVLTVSTPTVVPAITNQPQSQSATIGSNVTFTVAASGSPTPTLQWKKNGVAISGATSSTLALSSVQASDAATYTAVATNSAGSAVSSGAVLTVSASAIAPVITTQPQNQTTPSGGNVTFTAAATGTPSPTFQWRKNGANISGATSATLVLTNVQSASAGTYTFMATNSAGSVVSSGAVLTVSGAASAPAFTTQPLSSAIFVGGSVSFIAVASGSPTPSYQWQKGGVNIVGATSSTLTISNAQLAAAGSYAVIATNAAGSATSSSARLVVIRPQSNSISYESTVIPQGIAAGGQVNLYYLLTNTGTETWGVKHYLSVRDVNDKFVAFSSLIGVSPGESKSVDMQFTAPTTPGTYTYYVQALEDGVELFDTQVTVTLTVVAQQANSITYNTTSFPISAAPGSTLNFTYNVTNTGTKNWGNNHFLSLKDGSGTYLEFVPLNAVDAGQSKTVNFSFVAPTAPGIYQYAVQAVESGVEFFNTQAMLTLVVVAPVPNAIVYTQTRFVDNVMPGAALDLRYSLSNSGTQAWGSKHYASLRDSNGTFLSFIPLAGVPTAGNTVIDFNFVAPTTPGIYTYYVQALEDGVEFFETQDLVTITVVAPPAANAISYNQTTFPSVVTHGATVSFTHNITNRGTKTWGVNHYLTLRDADNTFLGFPTISGIAPDGSATMNFTFVAPTTPGLYTYHVQAMEAGVEFFPEADSFVLIVL